MRTLNATLLAAQKSATRNPIIKIVLTAGAVTKTYEKDRILPGTGGSESPSNQSVVIRLDNTDGEFTSLDLQGYKCVLSLGFNTSNGDDYDARAPLWVVGQQLISVQNTSPNLPNLQCVLTLGGIPNLLGEDRASIEYSQDDDDSNTVKTLIRRVLGDSGETILTCFNHTVSYDVSFDNEDSLVDSYNPADSFSIGLNGTRLGALRTLLGFVQQEMRAETDGKIHIFKPIISTSTAWIADTAYSLNDTVVPTTGGVVEFRCTTAGTSDSSEPTWPSEVGETVNDNDVVWTVSFDYEYNLSATYHTFYTKTLRERLVVPYKVTVDSLSAQDPSFTGSAQDSVTAALDNANVKKEAFRKYRVASNQECIDIATAEVSHAQIDAEQGHGFAPMNVGAEVWDFSRITDSRQNDNRVGNTGNLSWVYNPGRFDFQFRYGSLSSLGLMGTASPSSTTGAGHNHQDILDLINEIIAAVNINTVSRVTMATWIWKDASGNIHVGPDFGQYTFLHFDVAMFAGNKIGLLLHTGSDEILYWFDNAGAVDHTFGPETDQHGRLGRAANRWLSAHIETINTPGWVISTDAKPVSDNVSDIGDINTTVAEGYINKMYCKTRLKIPVDTDMFD